MKDRAIFYEKNIIMYFFTNDMVSCKSNQKKDMVQRLLDTNMKMVKRLKEFRKNI